MKTKIACLFIFSVLALSCNTKKVLKQEDYIVIYDNLDDFTTSIYNGKKTYYAVYGFPTVLTLKTSFSGNPEENTYECSFLGDYSYLGKWELEGDTLRLYPLYEFRYGNKTEMIKFEIDSPDYGMVGEIYHKWVIKGDRIYEKEEYVLHDEYDQNRNFVKTILIPSSNTNNYLTRRSKTKLK